MPGVIRTLVPKLKDDDTGVSSAVLAAIGELVVVASDAMLPFMDTLIPEILASLRVRGMRGRMYTLDHKWATPLDSIHTHQLMLLHVCQHQYTHVLSNLPHAPKQG